MKVDVIMPKMGESLQEGTIIRWLKKEGDKIERDEMILEISTDKVDTEVPAPVAGILSKILAKENETIEVGKVIGEIETEADAAMPTVSQPVAAAPVMDTPAPQATASANTIDVIMPKMGESLQEGTIIRWMKQVGETIERDEMILEISTDKVDTEVPAPAAGVLVEILAQAGETIEVGKVIAKISASGSVPATSVAAPVQSATQTAKVEVVATPVAQPIVSGNLNYDIPARKDDKFFSPLVREMAIQNKVSLNELETITGSGVDGRITKDDLTKYIANRGTATVAVVPAPTVQAAVSPAPAVQPTVSIPSAIPAPAPVAFTGNDEIIPMDRVRQKIAEHMVYSKHTSAHVTSVGEADVSGIAKFRNKMKDNFFKQEGIKLTFTPFFAYAAINALKKFPGLNVSVDGKNIILHKRLNLSVATALDDGNLIVPVIKNADGLSITGLQRAINDLATRARSKKLNPDDIQGGTFTITNVGTFGTLFGTPVINQPQTAIMGIGAIKKRPVVKTVDGEDLIVIRDMAYVSITYDHRVIDGMLAGQWLAEAIRILESLNEKTIQL